MMKHNLLTDLSWKWGLGLLLVLSACSGKARSNDAAQEVPSDSLSFHLPEIPSVLTEVDDRLAFLTVHYWDHFAFRDTNYIHAPEVTEQALVNYLDLLSRTDEAVADSAVTQLLSAASVEPKMMDYFLENSRRYLYDPNSPMRNESLYQVWAQAVQKHPEVQLAVQMQAQHDVKMIALNRPGEPANDFVYTLRDGRSARMSQLPAKPLLIFFYDPDCERCQHVLSTMKESPLLDEACRTGALTILAVYGDGVEEVWTKSKGKIPDQWIDSYDRNHTIIDRDLYDLSAMPSLYLLDASKKVILKDTSLEAIGAYLAE